MKNFEIKNNESGRSMIEMLGVLAIIGVLSVGGIAGYSKAMMKYRINKTIEQITLISANVRTFFAPQGNYKGAKCGAGSAEGVTYSGECSIVKKAKLIPDEMLTITDGAITNVENAFGGIVLLANTDKSSRDDNRAFYIEYYDIPEEACIELLSQDWTNANIFGVAFFSGTPRGLTPLDVARATKACSENHNENGNNDIMFYVDVDPAFFTDNLPEHYQL